MHFIYLDESKQTQGGTVYLYSALAIHESVWREVFDKVKGYRRHLRAQYGVYISKELHAWKFVAGKGEISDRVLTKQVRAQIFRETLEFMAELEYELNKVALFNSINANEFYAFERLINRVNRTLENWDSNAVLFFDEGQEAAITKRIRKMNVFNPIPSQYNDATRNIPINRIYEDPVFKDSSQSYFIQLVDFCAYALLRKEKQIASKNALGIHEAFALLEPICVKATNPRDPMGVIR